MFFFKFIAFISIFFNKAQTTIILFWSTWSLILILVLMYSECHYFGEKWQYCAYMQYLINTDTAQIP